MSSSKMVLNPNRLLKTASLLLCTVGFLFLTGCGDILVNHPDIMQPARQALNSGNAKLAVKLAPKVEKGQDQVLYQVELGRLQQIDGQYKQSLKTYGQAIATVRAQIMQAKIRLSKLSEDVASLLTNDKAIAFQLPGYGVTYLYLYQAMNYLALGRVSDALVSIRRMNEQQQWMRQVHYKQELAAQKKANEKKWQFKASDHKELLATLQAASKVKSEYQTAFGSYLAAMLFQATGDYNDAAVSIKRALNLVPKNTSIQQALLTILTQQGASSWTISDYQKQFGKAVQIPKNIKNKMKLVVLIDQGLIAPLNAVKIPIPLYNLKQVQTVDLPIFFPTYKKISDQGSPITIKTTHQTAHTHTIVTLNNLAAFDLKERYLGIFVRAALRLIAKSTATHLASKKDAWAGLAMQIFSLITSGADERSWLTLPSNQQIWQGYLPKGRQQIIIGTNNGLRKLLTLDAKAGETMLLWVMNFQHGLLVKSLRITS